MRRVDSVLSPVHRRSVSGSLVKNALALQESVCILIGKLVYNLFFALNILMNLRKPRRVKKKRLKHYNFRMSFIFYIL